MSVGESDGSSIDHARLLQASLLQRHRAARTGDLERDVAFSWSWAVVATSVYVLLLTDVLRTGIAVQSYPYPGFASNQYLFFGPYAYSVTHIQRNETSAVAATTTAAAMMTNGSVAAAVTTTTTASGARDIWAYKYDSTSIGMRTVAEYLRIEHWPPCVLYKTKCETRLITFSTIFGMLDSLVTSMAQHKSTRTPINITLRTTSAWIDRVHHFILPQFFSSVMTRTTQAIYYDTDTLTAPDFQFCSTNRVRPYACWRSWTRFTPLCLASNLRCQGVDRVFDHAIARYRSLQRRYIGMTLDFVVLESQDDNSKPAVSFQGRKFYDIVFITRVRDCSRGRGSTDTGIGSATNTSTDSGSGSNFDTTSRFGFNGTDMCVTIATDDFRYQSASLTSNAEDSYFAVACLRCLGQLYMWLRVFLLVAGCYCARAADPKFAGASVATRLRVALRTVFLIPSQVVVYGSTFPIVCYVSAHVLDSAIAYELVAQKFNSFLGVFALNLSEFLHLSAVSMRSVWVLAFLLHVVLHVRARHNAQRASGVPGIAEFVITWLSCLTILAQFRSIYFRDSRVLTIAEVVPSARVAAIRASAYNNAYSFWGLVLVGNTLDVKCLLASAVALTSLVLSMHGCLRVLRRLHIVQRIQLHVWSRSQASYAAGTLWATNALAVSWDGLFVLSESPLRRQPNAAACSRVTVRRTQVAPTSLATAAGSRNASSRVASAPPRVGQVSSTASLVGSAVDSTIRRRKQSSRSLVVTDRERTSRVLQCRVTVPDERSREVESMIYLMNLAVMTDPIVLLRLHWLGGGKTIGIYESRATQRLFLLPQAVRTRSCSSDEIDWGDYTLLLCVSTKDLSWSDLLHCG